MRKWLPLTAVCLGTFMLLIDVTIVNVALPDMAVDLKTSFSSLQWVVDIYALVLAALLLGAGSMADILGRRRVYILGLLLFAAASLASGLAPNGGFLILARGVQGVGAAAMFATTVALLNTSYSGQARGVAFGIWGAVSGAGAAIGPTFGGLLTEHLSWRWIFFVNLPISAIAIALSLAVLTAERGGHTGRFDIPGLITFTAFASLLTYGFIRAGDDGWLGTAPLAFLAGGVVALVLFILAELRSASPMLDLGLFRDRRFAGVMLAALALSGTAFGYLAYSSIWLQSVLTLTPVAAGLVYLPLSIASFVVSAVIGRRLHGTDPRWIIGIGMVLIGAGALGQAVLGSGSRWPALLIGLAVVGVGVGLVNPTMTAAVMSAVPPQRSGMAAGAMNTGRQLGFAFGIAVLGTIFQSRIASELGRQGVAHSDDVATQVSGGRSGAVLAQAAPADRPGLDHAIHEAFAAGLNTIFVVSGVTAVIVGLAVLVLLRPLRQIEPAAQTSEATVPA